ncbi:hypothetical protein M8J77_007518 [Diaphorina citri]|nr:hypothetical protein M8J77_007518 [Diaphorina citri]
MPLVFTPTVTEEQIFSFKSKVFHNLGILPENRQRLKNGKGSNHRGSRDDEFNENYWAEAADDVPNQKRAPGNGLAIKRK